jgi:hypothetical protein
MLIKKSDGYYLNGKPFSPPYVPSVVDVKNTSAAGVEYLVAKRLYWQSTRRPRKY